MRNTRFGTLLFISVTILLGFSQPLAGSDHFDEFFTSLMAEARFPLRTVELTNTRSGHSFYPDLFGSATPDPEAILVVDPTDRFPVDASFLSRMPESVAVLIVGPRHAPEALGLVAAALPDVSRAVPRIFLGRAAVNEWRVSVPGDVAPTWLAGAVADDNPVDVSLAQLNAARLGFGLEDPVLRTAMDGDIPAARLAVTSLDPVIPALDAMVRNVSTGSVQRRREDTNYLIVPLEEPFVVAEVYLVWSVVITGGLLLLYAVNRPRRVARYLRAIRHNLLAIAGLFLVLSASLIASNLVLRLVDSIPGTSPPPLVVAAGKFTVGFLVLAALYPLLHIRLRRSSAVYSGAALFLLLVGAVVSGAVSVILGSFFVVAFVFGFLFSIARQAWVKALCLLAATAPLVYLLIALAAVADPAMADALLRPPPQREGLTAVMLLPLLLMFFRLEALTPRLPLVPIMVMLSLIGLALVSATIIVDLRSASTVDLSITARVPATADAGGELTVNANLPLTSPVTVQLPSRATISCETIPCTRTFDPEEPPVRLDVEQSSALDRTSFRWSVEYTSPAEELQLLIESDTPIQLYASTLPAVQAIGTTSRRFEIRPGPFPPNTSAGTIILRHPSPQEEPTAVTIRVVSVFDETDHAGITEQMASSDHAQLLSY
ncbi:MAG TPA: hypothetical protein VJ932_00710, partial [Alkalispirochaeta sp.]|nr:hypothetical protein [Alkalispirochaeta sp.]